MAKIEFKFDRINALQFADIWNQLDVSQTGFIDGDELDNFFYGLANSILKKDPDEEELAEIKRKFHSAYGKSEKISMESLAKILLPADEQFLLFFRKKVSLKSSVAFMEIWKNYDQNCSGYLNVNELKNFVRDYVKAAGSVIEETKVEEYTQSIMKLFDRDNDEKLDLSDMARLLNLSENFLLQFDVQDENSTQNQKDFKNGSDESDQLSKCIYCPHCSAVMTKIEFKFDRINALQFADIWNQLDVSQTGFIDGNELDNFFQQLAQSIIKKDPTEEELAEIKKKFQSAYGKSEKISMESLAKILLPADEQFLLFFRKKVSLKSSVAFMKIWRNYDQNRSGYLSENELKDFVRDYVEAAGNRIAESKVDEYAQSIMKLFDRNNDKKLDLSDMARLLNLSENFLLQFQIQDGSPKQRKKDFKKIFKHYDQSRTGALEGVEVDGFIKDMLETIKGRPIQATELDKVKHTMLKHIDSNKDGKIQKSELALCLGVHL